MMMMATTTTMMMIMMVVKFSKEMINVPKPCMKRQRKDIVQLSTKSDVFTTKVMFAS